MESIGIFVFKNNMKRWFIHDGSLQRSKCFNSWTIWEVVWLSFCCFIIFLIKYIYLFIIKILSVSVVLSTQNSAKLRHRGGSTRYRKVCATSSNPQVNLWKAWKGRWSLSVPLPSLEWTVKDPIHCCNACYYPVFPSRGLYLTSILYRDDNVLVTSEDQIPIVEVEDSYSSSLMQDFLWFTKVDMWQTENTSYTSYISQMIDYHITLIWKLFVNIDLLLINLT